MKYVGNLWDGEKMSQRLFAIDRLIQSEEIVFRECVPVSPDLFQMRSSSSFAPLVPHPKFLHAAAREEGYPPAPDLLHPTPAGLADPRPVGLGPQQPRQERDPGAHRDVYVLPLVVERIAHPN